LLFCKDVLKNKYIHGDGLKQAYVMHVAAGNTNKNDFTVIGDEEIMTR
jgi:hypothetical protein